MAGQNKTAAEQELDALAEDWVTLWQSEIAGLMADPQVAEGLGALGGAMAAMGGAWLRAMAVGMPGQAGFPFAPVGSSSAGPSHDRAAEASARPAPAAAAPDAGGQPGQPGAGQSADAARRLAERLAELEHRLAEVERRPAGSGADRGGPRRRRPPA